MLVSLLCVFSLIAIRGLNLSSCDACGKDSFILESGNNHTKEAQPATCGNREDLLYENIANITFNQSSTLPALPEHIWIEVSSHQVDYISIEFMDTLINATTASSIPTPSELARVTRLRSHCTFLRPFDTESFPKALAAVDCGRGVSRLTCRSLSRLTVTKCSRFCIADIRTYLVVQTR